MTSLELIAVSLINPGVTENAFNLKPCGRIVLTSSLVPRPSLTQTSQKVSTSVGLIVAPM